MSQIQSWMDSDGNAHWPDANIGEIKDYQIDWEARIAAEGDTMATAVWTVPTGLTKTSEEESMIAPVTFSYISFFFTFVIAIYFCTKKTAKAA